MVQLRKPLIAFRRLAIHARGLPHRLGEKAGEIGGIVETQIISRLGDRHGGIEQRPLRFQEDALLDQLIRQQPL